MFNLIKTLRECDCSSIQNIETNEINSRIVIVWKSCIVPCLYTFIYCWNDSCKIGKLMYAWVWIFAFKVNYKTVTLGVGALIRAEKSYSWKIQANEQRWKRVTLLVKWSSLSGTVNFIVCFSSCHLVTKTILRHLPSLLLKQIRCL